eukprot:TRINITY_DN6563_c0_g1_i1.p1 TRINITY_DN6563_c0_g1~~TRINITY_DN6563_c0_g1_i1.p1  ORF type:complete len:159 (+),score=15.43 TRINITY_DN6563_c0_g1_i1:344-820(+)
MHMLQKHFSPIKCVQWRCQCRQTHGQRTPSPTGILAVTACKQDSMHIRSTFAPTIAAPSPLPAALRPANAAGSSKSALPPADQPGVRSASSATALTHAAAQACAALQQQRSHRLQHEVQHGDAALVRARVGVREARLEDVAGAERHLADRLHAPCTLR